MLQSALPTLDDPAHCMYIVIPKLIQETGILAIVILQDVKFISDQKFNVAATINKTPISLKYMNKIYNIAFSNYIGRR